MYIYKITNTLNDKIYIGLTTKSIEKRFSQHCQKKNNSRLISKAIKKYGKENFIIEEIDGANSISELNYKEQHYIHKFNSVKEGYNLASGGRFSKHSDETKLLLKEINTGKKHTEETKKKLREGNAWKGRFGKDHNRSKPILCIETNKQYGSIHEASRDIGSTASNICSVLNGRRKTTKGLTFKYLGDIHG